MKIPNWLKFYPLFVETTDTKKELKQLQDDRDFILEQITATGVTELLKIKLDIINLKIHNLINK